MTTRVLVTERLFWRHWPEVAPRFVLDHGALRTRDGMHCPITAVAEALGGESVDCGKVGLVLRRVDGDWPRWASRLTLAADYDRRLDDQVQPIRRRLLKHVPGANP